MTNSVLFNDANPQLNLNNADPKTPSTSFKLREKPDMAKDQGNKTQGNEIQDISEVTEQKGLEKLKSQVLEDIQANGGDSKHIKRSLTRGIAHRVWTQGAAFALLGKDAFGGGTLGQNLMHAGVPFEVAYQGINRGTDALGGSVVPELAKSYEAEDGKNKDTAGGIGHIAAKTTDHLIRGIIDPVTAATVSRGLSSVVHKAAGTGHKDGFLANWKSELTQGGDHNNGELIDELSYYGGLDAGIHTANALGLKKTWSGAVLASAIAAGCYTSREKSSGYDIGDANTPGQLSKKFIARTIQRLGVMGQIYALPLPILDNYFSESEDKADKAKEAAAIKKTPDEIAKDKKITVASRASEFLYGLTTFAALSGLYAYQNKKA